jgi:hypothetical protein
MLESWNGILGILDTHYCLGAGGILDGGILDTHCLAKIVGVHKLQIQGGTPMERDTGHPSLAVLADQKVGVHELNLNN